MKREKIEDKVFVSLVNNLSALSENTNENELDSKKINGAYTYKLENARGVVWASREAEGKFYSEFEQVQPAERKYAVFYKIKPTTCVVRPRDIISASQHLQEDIQNGDWQAVKNKLVKYMRHKNKNDKIENIICEIDDKQDVKDLHRLFNTESVQEVVKAYSKAFGATFWNYINEKDNSFFQVPTLMITDKTTMTNPKAIPTVSYLRRQMGANKYTGKNTMKVNDEYLNELLKKDLTVGMAVTLLKLREGFEEDRVAVEKIDKKLEGSLLLNKAMQIKEQDKTAIELSIVIGENKRKAIRKQIMQDAQLRQNLKKARFDRDRMDEYMAVFVEMIEEHQRKKLLEPEQEKNGIIEKIRGLFNRRKTKLLPEAQKEQNVSSEKERNKSFAEKLHETYKDEQPIVYPLNTVEGAIQQFLNAYAYETQRQNDDVYSILTSIGGKVEHGKSNQQEESAFLSELKQNNQINIINQNNAFFHLQTKSWIQKRLPINTRLYINPKKQNLIPMVKEIIKKNGDKPLYLKFESDNQIQQKALQNNGRSEKIVIYANDNEKYGNLGTIGKILTTIKAENPELFDGCEYMNPFMKNIPSICSYAIDPATSRYVGLDGRNIEISKSYNTFLAQALEESLDRALADIEKSGKINGFSRFNKGQQVRMMLESSPQSIVVPMKRYLAQCQKNNPALEIKGLEKNTQAEEIER